MRYRFVTCDVFTTKRFSGNQLAVLPDATGLQQHSARWTKAARPRLSHQADRLKESAAVHQS